MADTVTIPPATLTQMHTKLLKLLKTYRGVGLA